MSKPVLDARNATYTRGDAIEWRALGDEIWHPATYLAEYDQWLFVKDDDGPKIVNAMFVRKMPFKPGLFRTRVVSVTADGIYIQQEMNESRVAWFDAPPLGKHWERVT